MSAHTPGPWVVLSPVGRRSSAWVQAAAGSLVARVEMATASGPLPREANARLIAAAPDLLEALKRTLAHIDEPIGRRRTREWNEEGARIEQAARAAIAKAEGR